MKKFLFLFVVVCFCGAAFGAVEDEVMKAEVDWFAELSNGGNTAIALAVLFLAMIGFAVERLMRLRCYAICPKGLAEEITPVLLAGDLTEVANRCAKRPSILSRMITYIVDHHHADPDMLIAGAGDIAARGIRGHVQKAFPLAIIASLAPLLGLLGTMIGMIESFKLVEQYGDAGGASMLAGSISKALITTAVGLIIAIPSLGIYHFFKFRTHVLGTQLEEDFEAIANKWLLKPRGQNNGSSESCCCSSAGE